MQRTKYKHAYEDDNDFMFPISDIVFEVYFQLVTCHVSKWGKQFHICFFS